MQRKPAAAWDETQAQLGWIWVLGGAGWERSSVEVLAVQV